MNNRYDRVKVQGWELKGESSTTVGHSPTKLLWGYWVVGCTTQRLKLLISSIRRLGLWRGLSERRAHYTHRWWCYYTCRDGGAARELGLGSTGAGSGGATTLAEMVVLPESWDQDQRVQVERQVHAGTGIDDFWPEFCRWVAWQNTCDEVQRVLPDHRYPTAWSHHCESQRWTLPECPGGCGHGGCNILLSFLLCPSRFSPLLRLLLPFTSTVKSMKKLLRTSWKGRSMDEDALVRALLQYRNTPSRKDGLSPAQKLYGRPVQDTLPAHHRSFFALAIALRLPRSGSKVLESPLFCKLLKLLSHELRALVGPHNVRYPRPTEGLPQCRDQTGCVGSSSHWDNVRPIRITIN